MFSSLALIQTLYIVFSIDTSNTNNNCKIEAVENKTDTSDIVMSILNCGGSGSLFTILER